MAKKMKMASLSSRMEATTTLSVIISTHKVLTELEAIMKMGTISSLEKMLKTMSFKTMTKQTLKMQL